MTRVEAIEREREESAVSRLLAVLKEEVEEHSAYTNASGRYCVRNRTFIPTYHYLPPSSFRIVLLSSLSPLLPSLTTISIRGGKVYGERERKRNRKRMRHVKRVQDGREEKLEERGKPRRLRGRGCALRIFDLHMRILYIIYCVDHCPLYLLVCRLSQRKSAVGVRRCR